MTFVDTGRLPGIDAEGARPVRGHRPQPLSWPDSRCRSSSPSSAKAVPAGALAIAVGDVVQCCSIRPLGHFAGGLRLHPLEEREKAPEAAETMGITAAG